MGLDNCSFPFFFSTQHFRTRDGENRVVELENNFSDSSSKRNLHIWFTPRYIPRINCEIVSPNALASFFSVPNFGSCFPFSRLDRNTRPRPVSTDSSTSFQSRFLRNLRTLSPNCRLMSFAIPQA